MFSYFTGLGRRPVLVIALLAIVCLAVVGAVLSVDWSVKRRAVTPPEEEDFTFLCDKCSAVFTRLRKELPARFMEDRMAGDAAPIDCPRCGAKAAAYIPHRCPSCGKYYLTDACRDPLTPSEGPESDRCPHCGTVPYEWYLKHRR